MKKTVQLLLLLLLGLVLLGAIFYDRLKVFYTQKKAAAQQTEKTADTAHASVLISPEIKLTDPQSDKGNTGVAGPLNFNKMLTNDCLIGTCQYSAEVLALQGMMNARVAGLNQAERANTPLTGITREMLHRLRQLRDRYSVARNGVRFDQNGNLLPIAEDGYFGLETEELLWIFLGKRTTSLNQFKVPVMVADLALDPTGQASTHAGLINIAP